MTMISNMNYRLALTSQAMTTLGVDPGWDGAVSDFLRTFSLWQADENFGTYSKASEAWGLATLDLTRRFGDDWEHSLAGARDHRAAREALRIAEDAHHEDFVVPYWKALRDLTATPAPTIQAACFKTMLIQCEEIWNDSAMEANCMQLVQDDFARLAGES